MKKVYTILILMIFSLTLSGQNISGELQRWHKITITANGPNTSESATPNPFMNFRFDATFTHENGKKYVVPGYYAGCDNPAEGCDSGNKWKVHFTPDRTGKWSYKLSFKQGTNIAVKTGGESAKFFDNKTGNFTVAESDKTGRDFRAKNKGKLRYVGEHYLRFTGTGGDTPNGAYFIKAGTDAPENTLSYEDFDDTPNRKDLRKTWQPHQRDYNAADAAEYTWKKGKGTELLGVVNYIASTGLNAFSFLTWNNNGDDQNVFPHLLKVSLGDYNKITQKNQWKNGVHHTRFDVSKMAQWEKIFEYADKRGVFCHFKTMEAENCLLMDNKKFGNERKVYYRELIARFGHHLALNWNLSEETKMAVELTKATGNYIDKVDPYQNHRVLHTRADKFQDDHYEPQLGQNSLTGLSVQTNDLDYGELKGDVQRWIKKSKDANRKWVIAVDEPGNAEIGINEDDNGPDDKLVRNRVLWTTLLGGGMGVEYYYGYETNQTDLNAQDHRSRHKKYTQAAHAVAFFQEHVQNKVVSMIASDNITKDTDDHVFAKKGELYIVYKPKGGTSTINLPAGNWNVQWYNPRSGGALSAAKKITNASLVAPNNNDWVALIKKESTANPTADCASLSMKATKDFPNTTVSGFSPAYTDKNQDALAINAKEYKDKFAAAEATFDGNAATYNITINTLSELDGESTYRLVIDGKNVGTFKNPTTTIDYAPASKVFKNIVMKKGATIRVEFSSHTNGKIPEGDGTAFSRGRWTSLEFECQKTTVPVPVGDTCIPTERNGIVAVEAEDFFEQTKTSKRKWFIIEKGSKTPKPDPDNHPISEASNNKYIEILPDTRVIGHGGPGKPDPLIEGENFSDIPGEMAVLKYKVFINNPGKYYVWVRANSSGAEDNGIHVGIDGKWPESGQKMQWCSNKNKWIWESAKRLKNKPCDNPRTIFLDSLTAGEHVIQFSMREDGFEMDKFILSKAYKRPQNNGIDVHKTNCTLSAVHPFENIKERLSLSPNPAQNSITLNGLKTPAKATIYNVLGKKVLSDISFENNPSNEIMIDSLKQGMYFLTIKDENNNTFSLKFLKKS